MNTDDGPTWLAADTIQAYEEQAMNRVAEQAVIDMETDARPELPVAVAQPTGTAIATTTPADLLRIAVESGADLDRLERLMSLQDRWEAKQAKQAYDIAFAAFKAEAVVIAKGKDVSDGPLKGKKYAELHDVVNAVTPALSKHGLSSSWKLTRDEKDWMEVTCYLRHVNGHEESVSMGGPPDVGGAKNAIQARASTKTYLERYTLKAITGLSEQDDDKDGNPPSGIDQRVLVDQFLAQVRDAKSEAEVRQIWAVAAAALRAVKATEGHKEVKKLVESKIVDFQAAAEAK
ncbi:ERF family protein [Burkholderia cenocepacia]|uniref:ERF family protein n=1 Tax=Burkholderia cenocepacia TaxID=95486 RepID=UPI0020A0C78A|nr:ERF family protein [Burkholderia cenocepacia]MCO8325944.1 ERF family protein [Burkholderia cenocepacia]MCO8333014.1 ERF family protein [Burkholderia cenocepacia]MCO8340514.1 ERF family protein [Burkholderia cenocepacia]MCO8347800.1 ERF family protein [Burkholderia cenocepacia]MCO8360866.1 ERF family protein [Burkholderia cenocepacia]